MCSSVGFVLLPSCTSIPEVDGPGKSFPPERPVERPERYRTTTTEAERDQPELLLKPKREAAPKPEPELQASPKPAAADVPSWRDAFKKRTPQAPVPPMSPAKTGKRRVLFLGDSMAVGAFGKTFDQKLRDAGFEVYTSVAGGGTPYFWLKEYPPVSIDITYWERTPTSQRRLPGISVVPKVESLIAKWNPDIVVVQTGINMYAPLRSKKRSKADNIREIESVVDKMCRVASGNGKRQVYWITPPDSHVKRYPQALQDEMLAIMQRVAGQYGPVFNSYQVTSYNQPYPQSDGIHLTSSVSRRWGDRAANDFKSRFP